VIVDAEFVGRLDELDLLAGGMKAAIAQAPSFVLVEGHGGSGKTALLRAFTSRLGVGEVVRATGDEGETALPYGVLDQLVAQLSGVSLGKAPSAPDARSRGHHAAPRDPFVEGTALLQRIMAQEPTPLVLLLDDAHLADGPSLAAVTFALRRLRAERVLVVLTVRPEGVIRLPPGLGRLVAAGGARLSLGGLSVAEVQALAAVTGFGHLTERGAQRLQDHTGGNPLHLRALMADLTVAQVESVGTPLPAPRSLALLVIAALGGTQQSTQRLAAAAAVLGLRSRLRHVARLAGIDDPLPAVQELQRARIADLSEDQHDQWLTFVHPLVRVAVHDDLGAATRSDLHLGAAGLCPGAESLRHRVAAAIGPDPALAGELQAQAADARAAGVWRAAAEALFSAVRLSEPGRSRDHLLLDAVELLLLDGDLAAATGYAEALGQLPEDARRLQVQARIAWLAGRHDDAEALAQSAWSSAGEPDSGVRDDAAAMLSQMCILRGDGAGAARWAEQALASGSLSAEVAAAVRTTGATGLAMVGRIEDGMRLLGDLSPGPVDAGYFRQLAARGMLLLWDDDLAGARADLRASLPGPGHGPGEGTEPFRLVAMGYLAETEYRCGDWDIAWALAQQAVSLVEDTGQAWLSAFAHAVAALVPAARGQWDLAELHVTAAQQAAAALGNQASRAYADNSAVHVAACRGDPERVVAAAQWLLSDEHGAHHEPGFFGWSVQHAAALLELGRVEDAERRLADLEEVARARGRRSRLAALARVRGELAAARHDTSTARAAFDDALRLGDGAADALEAAMVQTAYGRFLRRRGERRSAVERLSVAQTLFAALGAEPFLRRCDAELAACGLVPGSGVSLDHPQLTPQESAVARLVCAGRTNRQVADELVLSVKTVGYHLGHVYTKLGVSSRMELAARMGASAAPRRT
jgi:ATP/maltotriose-dependent transcriptional regulator MalT